MPRHGDRNGRKPIEKKRPKKGSRRERRKEERRARVAALDNRRPDAGMRFDSL